MYRHAAAGIAFIFLAGATPNAQAVSTYTCTIFTEDAPVGSLAGVTLTGMNDQLQIAAMVQDFQSGQNTVFLLDKNGQHLPLTLPPFAAADPLRQIGSINNAGQVVGFAKDQTTTPPRIRGFISNPDGTYEIVDPPADTPDQAFTDIWVSGINDRGEVSGTLMGSNGPVSFIRDSAGFFTIYNDSPSTFNQHAINNAGTVVVDQNLRLRDGSHVPLAFEGNQDFPQTSFYGINDAGFVTGYITGFPEDIAIVRTPDGHAPAVVCPNRRIDIVPYAINNSGVVASATHANPVSQPLVVIATPTGFHSDLQLSNTSWSFSPSPVLQTGGTGTIYITSTGIADLEIVAIAMRARDEGDKPRDFQLPLFTCAGPLAPGQSCGFSFTFTPTGVGLRTAQIVIYDNAPDAPHIIRVEGMGLGKGRLQFSNQSWNFGEQPVGSTAGPGVIYIYNPGTDAINVSSIAISGTNPTDFAIDANTCGAAIAPYTTCMIGFHFAPQATGLRSAALTLNDDSTGLHAIPIAGAGH